ncbi:MAG: addiction module protein [Verrucomicrobia bacterium]|nr:addiction module protein [Verrucomicrobiota bacterium]MCG2680176.1 addiction module protein [Kiritimatiellia bacterium]MBU4247495.1 addiction module protein [Verrucomicrobiota bacterium]MBU4289464.1 addiction module protein [Verrucomicrobiota bacterium]MBU4429629.1 addiction module protein [Verrucomicrobiota bacterium]
MTVQTQEVLEKAIHLPPVERAELVEQILSSFDFPAREEIDALWAKEAEDRIAAYDRGEIKAIPASQVFEKINRRKS